MKQGQQDKSKIWQRHVEAAGSFPGSIHKYCSEREISEASFYYWRKKVGARAKTNSGSVSQPEFLPVIVSQTTREEALLLRALDERALLPDARWAAEFVAHLFRMSGGAR